MTSATSATSTTGEGLEAVYVPVERDVEHTRVLLEHVLHPVAVVDVPIHDQHTRDAQARARDGRSDSDVVEEAEAHRLSWDGEVWLVGRWGGVWLNVVVG